MKEAENFLDFVPKHNARCPYRINDAGQVEVQLRHRGLCNRIAQIFFQRPQASWIELEGMGSFIWNQMDGRRDVYEIGQLLQEAYGEEAQPLYERLCTYVKTLHRAGFIVYEDKE